MSTWWESFNLPESIRYGKEDYEYLWGIRPDKPHKVRVYGKEFDTPRLQKAYGRDYKFSGTIAHSDPVPEILNRLIEYMNDKYKVNFNQILINWYRDGEDYIGMHSDDESDIIKGSPVITVSLGTTRDFVLQEKKENGDGKREREVIKMEDNMVVVMGGTCQKTHKHGVPKRKRIKGSRISITLRCFTE